MISIRWRLTLLLGLLLGTILLATVGGIFLAMKNTLLKKFDETLTAKARALITASEIDGGEFEIDLTVKNFEGFGGNGADFFEIRRADGSTFLRSPSFAKDHRDSPVFPDLPRPDSDAATLGTTTLHDGRPARFYLQKIYPKGDKLDKYQDLYLIVATPTTRMTAEQNRLGTILLIASAAALLLMIPAIWFALRKGLLPLHTLTAKLAEIGPAQLDKRLASDALPAELTPVATSLNAWLDQLEESFNREREFTSHAAHELRTPLAELRMMAELAAMSPEEATPESSTEMLAVIDETTALLEKLAALARSENGSQQIWLESFSLAEAVSTSLTRFQKAADARQQTFQSQVTDAPFTTDPLLWRTILDNLISNAISYSPKGSVIHLEVSPQKLLVRNPAPNLEQADLAVIFHRFWRKEHSRGNHTHGGLGLPLVKNYTTLLGGECHLTITPTNELEFEIKWQESATGSQPDDH